MARLTSRLSNRGLSVVSMSGELSQQERTNALQAMRDGRARVCVATDVAARGIDLPGLELVIHADLPKNQEALLHRSGRTARAGKEGTTIVLATHEDEFELQRMAKTYDIDIEKAELPEDPHREATELLEKRYFEAKGELDDIDEFVPLVRELSEDQPELLASLVNELYVQSKQDANGEAE